MKPSLNQVQIAWIRAIEKKLGHKVKVETPEDIRVLARIAVTTVSPDVIIYD